MTDSDVLGKAIVSLFDRFLALAAENDGVRADLHTLAGALLAATEPPRPRSTVESAAADDVRPDARAAPVEPLRELTLGKPRPSPSIEYPSGATDAGSELADLEDRCRRKAEAVRGVAARLMSNGDQVGVGDRFVSSDPEVAAWADRLANDPRVPPRPLDPAMLNDLAGCFDALAEALALARDVGTGGVRRGLLERSLFLVAEGQSALRAAVLALGLPGDPEQVRAFEWLRGMAARHQIYISKFMRADRMAEPSRWPDLIARVAAVGGKDRPPRVDWLARVRPRVARIREGRGTDEDWREVAAELDRMVAAGGPPSNRDVRDLLLPVVDDLPDRDDFPHGFRLVLREIDRFLANRPSTLTDTAVSVAPAPAVKEARRLLQGRSAVLIGGGRRRDAQKGLTEALGLKELVWLETREHQSISAFEAVVARPDVAVVLLAIRWSSHSFGDVKQFCDRHGKPLVRLPGGYNANQVAAQILAQCSEQLGAE